MSTAFKMLQEIETDDKLDTICKKADRVPKSVKVILKNQYMIKLHVVFYFYLSSTAVV